MSPMWKPSAERWGLWAFWGLVALCALDRIYLLCVFGFRYVGIDDALIQQVAVDYGHGIFREPFLYGQNYNPMLEAFLAAPFVRLGGAPWIVLPIITSFLALIPFWSLAFWSKKNGWLASSLAFAFMPLLLPVEWGMMTSMSRGFVHGIALLAFLPWVQEWKQPLPKHAFSALILVAALFCNPNAFPLVAGSAAWLLSTHFKRPVFWSMNFMACGAALVLHMKAQSFFDAHPLIHPLAREDLHFSFALLRSGILHLDDHFLHVNPFGGWAILILVGLLADAYSTWRLGHRAFAGSLLTGVLATVLALGVVKVHEGCASVFFPMSRMFLSLPLMLATAAAIYLHAVTIRKWVFALLLLLTTALLVQKTMSTEEVIQRELAQQSCGYVREEAISDLRARCERIKAAAHAQHADVVVPVRWPGIRVDHQAHFAAHFTCYACEQLVRDFPPVYGAGYDRRSWRWVEHEGPSKARVLFVGGDTTSWAHAMAAGRAITNTSAHGFAMHTAQCDTISIGDFLVELGIDDDLGR